MSKIKDWAEQEFGENYADADLENDIRREIADRAYQEMAMRDYECQRDDWRERWD